MLPVFGVFVFAGFFQGFFTQDCTNELDLVFALDASGSIGPSNFRRSMDFVVSAIDDLSIDEGIARVGLLVYSTETTIMFDLNDFDNKADMLQKVSETEWLRGKTSTASAIRVINKEMFTENKGDRPAVHNSVILFTDGESDDPEQTVKEAFEAKQRGIHILVVAMGGWVNEEELKSVASYPYTKNKVDVSNFDELPFIRDDVLTIVCNSVNECAERSCRNGGVAVDGPGGCVCDCPTPWGGATCSEQCTGEPKDIIFALDASTSLGPANFQLQIDIVSRIINGLNIGQTVRVGLITYADEGHQIFQLNFYATKFDVLNAMSVHYMRGGTNTAAAIAAAQEMFTPENGDRTEAENILVIFTDGIADDREAAIQRASARRGYDNQIQIVAVGVGQNIDSQELQAIASEPKEFNVIEASSWQNLLRQAPTLIQFLCNDGCDNNNIDCLNGGNRKSVANGCMCVCREGFRGDRCEFGCSDDLYLSVIVDSSGSIRNERFPHVLDFIGEVLQPFRLEGEGGSTKISLTQFSDFADIIYAFEAYSTKHDAISAIKRLPFMGGETNIAEALQYTADSLLAYPDGKHVILLFTDGASNVEASQTIPAAIAARQNGAHIVVFGVGDSNLLELRAIASRPYSENLFFVKSFANFQDILGSLQAATCDDFNECQSSPCQNGGACVDNLKSYFCSCERGFGGINCETECNRQMDISLVLDLSGSVSTIRDVIIEFAYEYARRLPIGNDVARVATISYSDSAVVDFDLNDYSMKWEVLNALSFNPSQGRTGTREALQLMNEEVFTSRNGDRTGVPNIAVVITDGWSNINNEDTIPEANLAKDSGAIIYSVAVGNGPNYNEIDGMASQPASEYTLTVQNSDEVEQRVDELISRLCQG